MFEKVDVGRLEISIFEDLYFWLSGFLPAVTAEQIIYLGWLEL